MRISPFVYSENKTPNGYVCDDCSKNGVILYREYNTCLEGQHLRCLSCALKNQKQPVADDFTEYSVGWLVAAVPTEDGETYWGYSSVPDDGVKWWDQLPKEQGTN